MSENQYAGSLPIIRLQVTGMAESQAVYTPGPSFGAGSGSDDETTMVDEIDGILARLGTGIPKLHREMDDLLARIRGPVAA